MDLLLAALGHHARIEIAEFLLGLDEPDPSPRGATHADLRAHLNLHRGTLSKALAKLKDAGLVSESPGPRADQAIYHLRKPALVLSLLQAAASLDAAISDELATLHRVEADLKADRAQRLIGQHTSSNATDA
jgi:DNA-binding MarR family transcriptional regulator